MSEWEEPTENQETVHFLDTQSRDVTVDHFLSPWLQETAQGCFILYYFIFYMHFPELDLLRSQNKES